MIPPFVTQIIGMCIRGALYFASGWLEKKGVNIGDSELTAVVTWATPLVAALAWSYISKHTGRLKLLTAQSRANLTEHQVEQIVADPAVPNPSLLTPKSEVPQ